MKLKSDNIFVDMFLYAGGSAVCISFLLIVLIWWMSMPPSYTDSDDE